MILTAKHPQIDSEKSFLAQPVTAGATKTFIKSTVGLLVGQYIVIGIPGEEKTEIALITAVTASEHSVSHAALKFGHSIESPVSVIKYNQVKFYKSSTINGSYSLITTVDIDIDDSETKYDYSDGLTTDYYKISYFNFNTSTESLKSAPLIGTGYSEKSLSYMIDRVRDKVGKEPSDEAITALLNEAQNVIFSLKDRWYFAKKKHTITPVDATTSYATPSDFRTIGTVFYINGTTVSKMTYKDYDKYMTDFYPSTDTNTPSIITIDEANENFLIYDKPLSVPGTIEVSYWASPTPLSDFTDETVIPIPAALWYYAASKIEAQRKNGENAKLYWNEYSSQMALITNKRVGKGNGFYVRG